MRIVLKEDFPALGYVGETVTVRPGYGRNFLIPRGIAVESSSRKARELTHKLNGIIAKKARLKKECEAKKAELEGLILEFVLKVGKGGKSFGSISMKNIEDELKAKGFAFDRKQLRLPESIKSGGSFPLEIKLHSEVVARATIRVVVERELASTQDAAALRSSGDVGSSDVESGNSDDTENSLQDDTAETGDE